MLWEDFIINIVLAVFSVVAAVVSFYVVPFLKSKIGAQQYEKLLYFIKLAVRSAEQLFDASDNEEKKKYVLNAVKNMLETSLNINLTDEQLDTLIEGIVHEVKKG